MKSYYESDIQEIKTFAEFEKMKPCQLVYFPELGDEACSKQEFIDLFDILTALKRR